MAGSRKADLETYVDTFVTRMRVGLAAPLVAIGMWAAGGVRAKARAADAADQADRTLNALTGNPVGVWLSQGAANNAGIGWRALAALLEAGWPGHIEQFKQGN